jgi:hypothetical protein
LHFSLKLLLPVILIRVIQGLPVNLGGEHNWNSALSEPFRSFTMAYGAPNTILIACFVGLCNRSVRPRRVRSVRVRISVDASTAISELFTVEFCLVADSFRW